MLPPTLPSKIIAVGKNYSQHAAEMGGDVPQEPLLFMKPPTSLIANEQLIYYPPQSQRVDYEGELALVIGENATFCTPAQARRRAWGCTNADAVTARDLQQKDGQWTRAKGFDTFCPLGPWIVREVSAGAKLQTFLNDDPQPKQSASINSMVFSPEMLVSYVTHIMTLVPGDVILTGTPAGIGPLQVGDLVRVAIEGIGTLANTVASRSPKPAVIETAPEPPPK